MEGQKIRVDKYKVGFCDELYCLAAGKERYGIATAVHSSSSQLSLLSLYIHIVIISHASSIESTHTPWIDLLWLEWKVIERELTWPS